LLTFQLHLSDWQLLQFFPTSFLLYEVLIVVIPILPVTLFFIMPTGICRFIITLLF
jgi:hypothetical protein